MKKSFCLMFLLFFVFINTVKADDLYMSCSYTLNEFEFETRVDTYVPIKLSVLYYSDGTINYVFPNSDKSVVTKGGGSQGYFVKGDHAGQISMLMALIKDTKTCPDLHLIRSNNMFYFSMQDSLSEGEMFAEKNVKGNFIIHNKKDEKPGDENNKEDKENKTICVFEKNIGVATGKNQRGVRITLEKLNGKNYVKYTCDGYNVQGAFGSTVTVCGYNFTLGSEFEKFYNSNNCSGKIYYSCPGGWESRNITVQLTPPNEGESCDDEKEVIVDDGEKEPSAPNPYEDGYTIVTGCPLGPKVTEDLKGIFNIFKILGPILVIGLSSLEFIKALTKGEIDSESKKIGIKIVKRMIFAIILFVLPILIEAFGTLLGLWEEGMMCDLDGSNISVGTVIINKDIYD